MQWIKTNDGTKLILPGDRHVLTYWTYTDYTKSKPMLKILITVPKQWLGLFWTDYVDQYISLRAYDVTEKETDTIHMLVLDAFYNNMISVQSYWNKTLRKARKHYSKKCKTIAKESSETKEKK